MPLISYRENQKKERLKVDISSEVHKKILAYCKWSGINDIGFFIEEAALYVFAKDKVWKQHLKEANVNSQDN